MEDKQGWISLHRKLLDNPIWSCDTFSRGQAWVDLLLLVNHKDGHIRINGERIEVTRGQTGRSILTLSKRWKWSRGKTTRFLKELQKDSQIILKTNTKNSIITICNYDTFQRRDTTTDTTSSTTNGHQVVQQTDTNNNENNNNNNNKGIKKTTKPANVSDVTWDNFKKLRTAKKAPITDLVVTRILGEVDKAGVSLEEALQECCERGWTSFKADWYNNSKGNNYGKRTNTKQSSAHDDFTKGIALGLAELDKQQGY